MTSAALTRHRVNSETIGGATCVVTAAGELTFSAIGDLEREIESRLTTGCLELVIDLVDVTAVRPSAEIVLRQLRTRLSDRGVEVAAAAAVPAVTAALIAAGVAGSWPLATNRDEALATLLSRPVV